MRRLTLRREALTALTDVDLARVAGAAAGAWTFPQCLDEMVEEELDKLVSGLPRIESGLCALGVS